jgi:hypothetical protein
MRLKMQMIAGILLFAAFLHPGGIASAGEGQGSGDTSGMKMHHFHIMMNHGITMVAEGSNLVMLAGMKMAAPIDKPTLKHGQMMLAQGKEVIRRSLSGPEMEDMMKGKHADSPLMHYTHEIGEAMLKVIQILEKMDVWHMSDPNMMTMHHMHIALNHALQMASEGSNLVMLGQMGMAGDVDSFSVDHGKEMIENARGLYSEIMDGRPMQDMHEKGKFLENLPMMKLTNELAESILKVIDLLGRMKPVSTG